MNEKYEMRNLMDYLDRYVFGPMNLIDDFEGLIKGLLWGDTFRGEQIGIVCIDRGGTHTLHECEDMLSLYGIKIRRRKHDHHSMYATVTRRQKRWAYYVLQRNGVMLTNPVPSRFVTNRRGEIPAWADKKG